MARQNSLEANRQKSIQVWTQAQRQALHEAVKNTPVNPVPAASSGAGGAPVLWQVVTNTAYIYPIINIEEAAATTTVPFTRDGNRFIFATVQDVDTFYGDVWSKTAISQPVGNQGYSMGVGTRLAGSFSEIRLELQNGTLIILWQEMTQLTDQTENLPQWIGNSPKGTVGYGAVYSDPNGDGIPTTINDVNAGNIDPLRFVKI